MFVSPKTWMTSSVLRAFRTRSDTTVLSLPPEKLTTGFFPGYFDTISFINLTESSCRLAMAVAFAWIVVFKDGSWTGCGADSGSSKAGYFVSRSPLALSLRYGWPQNIDSLMSHPEEFQRQVCHLPHASVLCIESPFFSKHRLQIRSNAPSSCHADTTELVQKWNTTMVTPIHAARCQLLSPSVV